MAEYLATVDVPRSHRVMATPSEQALGMKAPLRFSKRTSNFKQNGRPHVMCMVFKTIVSHYWNDNTPSKIKNGKKIRKNTHLPLGYQKEKR